MSTYTQPGDVAAISQQQVTKNPTGTAGGVVGIVNISLSLFLSWIVPFLFVVLSIVSITLSAIGLKKANEADLPKGMAITGLATSIPTLLWSVIWSFVLLGAAASSGV